MTYTMRNKVKLMTDAWEADDLPFADDNKALPRAIEGIPLKDVLFDYHQPDSLDGAQFNLFIFKGHRAWLVQSSDFTFVDTTTTT